MSAGAHSPGWAGRLATVSAVVLSALVTACGNTPTGPTRSTSPPSLSPSPSPLDLKPVLAGLLDRNGMPPAAYLGSLAGYVVNVHWSDLQPNPGAAIAPDNAIDHAIAQVDAVNTTDHTHLGLKIRVFAGVFAPEWVKTLGGGPVTISNPQNGATGTVGRFWIDAFAQAYDRLEMLLAAKYDQVPAVREVTISRCTTFYDEPFVRDTSDPATVSALVGAGYTLQADENCQRQEIDSAAVWRHTHADLAFNPYQAIEPGGTTRVDEAFTESMMVYCRHVLGSGCVLENNSLRSPAPGAAYSSMYASMTALGAPIAFQTATATRVGSLPQVLADAVSLGASSVELPAGYESIGTPPSFATAARLLAGNAPA